MELTRDREHDRTCERSDPDRRERSRRRRVRGEPAHKQQQRDDDEPSADPEERAHEAGDKTDQEQPHGAYRRRVERDELLERLREDPQRTGILLDVDGVLAPIVDRPEDARVPDATRNELRRLAQRYALVGCVSGRAGDDARRVVGVDELVYVGEHGLELDPQAPAWRGRMRAFADGVAWPVEDKGLTLSFHYRTAEDPAAAEEYLLGVAEGARTAGLVPRFGRMVLEVRPPLETNKGTAVRYLLEARELQRALYAGDDSTDLDAFRALDDLEWGIRVGVVSDEGPRGIADAADVVVQSPADLVELLRTL